jgi:hypothetical protein
MVMVQHETSLSKRDVQAIWDRLESVTADRRRPGRLDHVSPNLIPLLRGEVTHGQPQIYETDLLYGRGNLKPAFGIVVGLFLNLPLWAVIGFASWASLH